jgi:hypothetical protein
MIAFNLDPINRIYLPFQIIFHGILKLRIGKLQPVYSNPEADGPNGVRISRKT